MESHVNVGNARKEEALLLVSVFSFACDVLWSEGSLGVNGSPYQVAWVPEQMLSQILMHTLTCCGCTGVFDGFAAECSFLLLWSKLNACHGLLNEDPSPRIPACIRPVADVW